MSVEILSKEELENSLDMKKIPKHIAIIMDGNGRWADRRNLPRADGHRAGIEAVRDVVEACGDFGIQVLTLFTFSTENWKRPSLEINALMRILLDQLHEQTPDLNSKNVKINFIGDISRMPKRVVNELQRSIDMTKNNTGLILNLALNYGGRQEIIKATKAIAHDVVNGKLKADKINEKVFSKYLYTSEFPDPDIIIRTSGEMRISNFLLWQCAYSEIYITEVLWPDFRRKDFLLALLSYQKRKRRFGGV